YQLNREHLAAPAVIQLAGLRTTLLERLRAEIATWGHQPVYAALFGSSARGEMHVDSDLDVFVVRPDTIGTDETAEQTWQEQLADLADRATSWSGNDMRFVEMSLEEVQSGLAEGDPLLADIERDAVLLSG